MNAHTSGKLLRLECTAGKAVGADILVEDQLVIGRHSPGPGMLQGDEEISRVHARISRSADGYAVEDLASTNGTYVNGVRLAAAQALAEGDTIAVGTTQLVVHFESAPLAAPPTAIAEREPEPEPAPEPAAAAPPLVLRLEVDFDQRVASLQLEGESEPLRLVHDVDGWRLTER
jgi:predicted component of type VI protein secretion system